VRAALIVNPFASAVTDERLAQVEAELGRTFDVTVSRTERPRHATELAAARSADVVVVYGGDGLLNEAVNGLDGSAPVAVVPGGGKNVVARALGIPIDPVAAARLVAHAHPRRIGLGRVNDRRFVFAAGLGFDAELVRRVDALGRRPDGRRPGDRAFVTEAVKLLAARGGRYAPVLEIEGLGRAGLALVANGGPYSYFGSRPLWVAPDVRFELGLDLVAPQRVSPLSIPRLLGYALRGRGQQDARDVLYAHDRDRIAIRTERPLALQADGEDLGDVTEAVFEAERDAIAVLVPG
jgi:diacylglycerol kinase family enzyme